MSIEIIEEGLHECSMLDDENLKREEMGESKVTVFQDVENGMWTMRVGLEFIEMQFCPWCGRGL